MPSAPLPAPSPRRSLGVLALLLALAPACAGKDVAESTPPTTTITNPQATPDDALKVRLALLEERLEAARIEHHIPGMAVAVVKGDEVIFAKGFGYADLESKRPATADTVFAVGSTTKAFTSTLVAMQVDEGVMAWDDPITKYVPEMKLKVRAAEGTAPEPTVRDVLCHRTGFTRMSLLWAGGADPLPGVLAAASSAEPWAEFRETFLYNNVTYASAGAAAARTADTSWSAMLQARIFEPLGMADSTATVAEAQKNPNLATGYRWREVSERHEALPMRNLDGIGPAGSINSTANDMSHWLRFQLGRGNYQGQALLSNSRIDETWSPQIEVGGGVKYGLGWMLGEWEGHRMVEHGGNIDGFAAEVGMLPDDQIGFVLLTNVSVTPLQRASLGIVFDSLLGELPNDGGPAGEAIDMKPYPGKYVADFGPFDDQRFTVTTERGVLYVDVPGQTKYELKAPDAEGHWAFALTDTIKVYFDVDEDSGKAQVLHMLQGGLDLELPREGYVSPPEVTLEKVSELLGRYELPGKLGVTVKVSRGRLVADIDKQMAFDLREPGKDGRWHFRAKDDLAVSFRRDAKGQVDALVIHEAGKDQPLPRVRSKVENPPTVEQLLARGNAQAFEKRFAKLGVIEVQGTVRMPSSAVEGRFRMVLDNEGRRRFEADFGKYGRSIETFDGQEAWSVSTLSPPTQAEGKYLEQARVMSPLFLGDWVDRYEDVRVAGWTTRDDKKLVEVVLRHGELPPQRVFVDPKSGQVLAFEQVTLAEGMGAIPTKGTLSDYRKEEGLMLPHRMVTSTVHSGETILEAESVKAIEGDPAKLFGRGEL